MKVSKRPILFALVVYLATSVFGIGFFLAAAAPAHAEESGNGGGGPPPVSFAFDYDSSPQNVTAMLNAIKNGSDDPSFQNSEIYAQGGLFGSGAEFTYQRMVGNGTLMDFYQYSYDYTCVNGQPQTQPADSSQNSYTVEVSVYLYLTGGNFNNDANLNGAFYHISHVTFNGAQVNNQAITTYPDAHNVNGIPSNDSALQAMHFPSSCVAYPFSYGDKHSADEGDNIPNLEDNPTANANWQAAIQAAQAAGPGGTGPTGGSVANPENVCAQGAGAFGWILCPAIDLVNNFFAGPFQSLVTDNLKVDPLDTTGAGSQNNQNLYNTWNNIRTLADALFILIFLVIIFANTLQFNLNAYAIKKMIPKLVAAAILVQFSFVISALAIDFGNIVGDGINGLIQTASSGGGPAPAVSGVLSAAGTVIGVAVAGTVVATAGIVAVISTALAALFAFLAILITLVIRKLLIDVLIVMSPLAFVAFVLPGTERLFRLWYQNFIRVILMYPLIAILFGMSSLLVAATSGGGFQAVIAAAFPISACFLVPTTFSMGGKLMSVTGNLARSQVNKVGGKAKSGWKDSDAAKNLANRQASAREARLQRLDSRLSGWSTSGNRLKRAAAKTGFHAGALAMGAGVNDYEKELKELKQASVGNVKNALTARFSKDPTKRKNAEDALRAAGAGGLMSYTKTHEGRQALMRRLADKDLTGLDLVKAIRDPKSNATDRDRAALVQENGKNIPSSLGLFGDFSPGGRGETALRNTTAADIKKDWNTDNFDAGLDASDTQAQAFEASFAEHMSDVELEHVFDTTHRDTPSLNKRVALLRMMARKDTLYGAGATGHGKALREALQRQVHGGKSADAVALLSAREKTVLGI
jgi:hypothetical protein